MSSLDKAATAEGTRSYADASGLPARFTVLGRTGLWVSPVGFGGYRVHADSNEHRDALKMALASGGCNLIDTSTNYGDGGSERLIGEVLRELAGEGKIRREQIVVVTKAGYLQGENLNLARQRKSRGIPFPEVTEYSDGCWHCISPEFLRDQITRSLQRLGLSRIDVLLLHNPEYYLKAHGDHREYYRRIAQAFKHLETEVRSGRIQYYGISSNTFPSAKEDPDFTSLQAVLDLAAEADAKHFAVIQFPFNLYEPGAAYETNNGSLTLLEAARKNDLGVLINRPLNAFHGNKLIRLASFENKQSTPKHSEDSGDPEELLKDAFLDALQIETDSASRLSEEMQEALPARNVSWAHVLRRHFDQLTDLENWRSLLEWQIEPSLEETRGILASNAAASAWFEEYQAAIQTLCSRMTDYLEELSSLLSNRISENLVRACPPLAESPTLSRKALRIYGSLPGIHCVLIGMRKSAYVIDALSASNAGPLTEDQAMSALGAIQRDIEEGASHAH